MLLYVFDFHHVLVAGHRKVFRRDDFIEPDRLKVALEGIVAAGHRVAIASCGRVAKVSAAMELLFAGEDCPFSRTNIFVCSEVDSDDNDSNDDDSYRVDKKFLLLCKIARRFGIERSTIRFYDDKSAHVAACRRGGFQSFLVSPSHPVTDLLLRSPVRAAAAAPAAPAAAPPTERRRVPAPKSAPKRKAQPKTKATAAPRKDHRRVQEVHQGPNSAMFKKADLRRTCLVVGFVS
jgi:hypothetical protein